MKAHYPYTGPPRRKVDAPESSWSISQSRYQPVPARENPEISFWRQVRIHPVGLVRFEKAISGRECHWLRATATERRSR